MRFASPLALAALALAPALVLLWRARRDSSPAIVLPSLDGLSALPRSPRAAMLPMLLVLRCIAVGLLAVAIARPQLVAAPSPESTNAVDIFVVLDVSSSMASADFQPFSRLEVAKRVITRFVEGRPGDRLGLIAFARYSTLKCPLTMDHEILKLQLDRTDMAAGDDDGTAIGMALASSVNHMRRSPAKSRVVVLLTDGENNRLTIDPSTGAELARAMGVTVYSIGVGKQSSDAPSAVVSGDAVGTSTQGFNEGALQEIATATGGRYFRAVDLETLEEIFHTIDDLERSPVPALPPARSTELYWIALVGALLAAGAELLFRVTVLRRLP